MLLESNWQILYYELCESTPEMQWWKTFCSWRTSSKYISQTTIWCCIGLYEKEFACRNNQFIFLAWNDIWYISKLFYIFEISSRPTRALFTYFVVFRMVHCWVPTIQLTCTQNGITIIQKPLIRYTHRWLFVCGRILILDTTECSIIRLAIKWREFCAKKISQFEKVKMFHGTMYISARNHVHCCTEPLNLLVMLDYLYFFPF